MANENPTQIPISKLPEFKSDPDGFMVPGYKSDQPTAQANLGKMIDKKTKQALAQTQQQIDSINRDMGKYQQLPDVTLTLVESGKRFAEDGSMIADSSWNIGRLGAVRKGNIYELLMGGSDKMVLGTALFVSHTVERIGGVDTDVYKHIYSAVTTDLPISNYAVLLAGEDYADVLVSYRADVTGSNVMLVSRWGIFASLATQFANLRGEVNLRAFADGYYDNMGVGYARNLIGDGEPTTEEFTERVAGGSHEIDDSIAEYSLIKGNTLVWNQLNKNASKEWQKATATRKNGYLCNQKMPLLSGRKYLQVCYVDSSSTTLQFVFGDNIHYTITNPITRGLNYIIAQIGSQSNLPSSYVCIRDTADSNWEEVSFRDYLIYDLTQMFGAGNEPTTYEDFLLRKPVVADEYAYNEGTIVNMTAEGVKTTGRNLWDEEWERGSINAQGLPVAMGNIIRSKEFCRCLPNCKICFSCQSVAAKLIYWYDANKAFISRVEVATAVSKYGIATSPANACFFKIRNDKSTYHNDICINLSDPSFNGKYEPYQTSERKWAETMKKCFPDGMAKVGSVYDEFGSTKAVQRIIQEDVSNIRPQTTGQVNKSYIVVLSKNHDGSGRFVCEKYENKGASSGSYITANIDNIDVGLYQYEYTDTYMYLVIPIGENAPSSLNIKYVAQAPIVTTYDELNLTSRVWRDGMEEIIVPEGKQSTPIVADINYQINAYKTIKANKQGIEELNAKPAIGLTADEVAKLRALINPSTQNLEEE